MCENLDESLSIFFPIFYRKGFKYVPLNSMTLSARKPASQTSTDDEDTSGEQKSNEASSGAPSTKRPWWQSLPAKKKNKNQVILDEYEKIKSTLPEWPWMSALKNGNTPTGLTRSKLTNRVVVTTSNKPETSISSTTTTTTLKPMEESSTIMNQEGNFFLSLRKTFSYFL